MRAQNRAPDDLRPVSLERKVARYAEGSCLVKFGETHVLCTASLEDKPPMWLRGQGRGWVTAEYAMLPRATHTRSLRESASGRPSGRTQEIQRLIGRSLRAVMNLPALGERQITVIAMSFRPMAAHALPRSPARGWHCMIASPGGGAARSSPVCRRGPMADSGYILKSSPR
jgi:hypothetical protein